jgi:hypothetical protein
VVLVGSSPASGKPVFIASAGAARASSTIEATARYGNGRPDTRWAKRHHAVSSAGLTGRRRPTSRPASMRLPSSDSRAGSSVRAAATANSTTSEVLSPIEARKPRPVSTRAAIATTTVPPASRTAEPADPMAFDSAVGLS